MYINTRQFEAAHGRKPRGTGDWAFVGYGTEGPIFWFNGSYTAAKAAAKRHFRGLSEIVVCS